MAYKFVKTIDKNNAHSIANITFDLPDNDYTLEQILEEFRAFLAACTYSVPGTLEHIVEED